MDRAARNDKGAASSDSFTIRVLGRADVAVMEALNDVFGVASVAKLSSTTKGVST